MRLLLLTVFVLGMMLGALAPANADEAPTLSQSLISAIKWLLPGTDLGHAQEWLEFKGCTKDDVALRLVHWNSHGSMNHLVILKNGDGYSWRHVWGRSYQAASNSHWSKEDLSQLRQTIEDESVRLGNLDGKVFAADESLLFSIEERPESPFVIAAPDLPPSLKKRIAHEMNFRWRGDKEE